jgi:hypothetical protein
MKYILDFNSFLIKENKVFSPNIVNSLLKKFKSDNSNIELINKITIFGLFRNSSPFNTYDISTISQNKLDELFEEWYNKTVERLVSSPGNMKGNKDVVTKYLNAYINNISKLNVPKPFSFKNYEETLVDIVNNNGWIKQNKSTAINSITNPISSDVVYDDENITIVKGDTKEKCVMYGNGYSWCISQSDLNYYTTYRVEYKATIYFVLNKNLDISNKERLCVILRYPNDKFAIADKSNSGDRSGGIKSAVDGFRYIESQLPWLKDMEQYFPYKNITTYEKKYTKMLKTSYLYNDLGDWIKRVCSEELKKTDTVDFFRDYVMNHKVYSNQIKSLDNNMLVQLIESGTDLDNNTLVMLPSNLRVRYGTVRLKHQGFDMSVFSLDEIDRVIKNVGVDNITRNGVVARDLILSTKNVEKRQHIRNLLYDDDIVLDIENYKQFIYGTLPEKQLQEIYDKIIPDFKKKSYSSQAIMKAITNDADKYKFFVDFAINNIDDMEYYGDYVSLIRDNNLKLDACKKCFDLSKHELGEYRMGDVISNIYLMLYEGNKTKFLNYMKPDLLNIKVHETFALTLVKSSALLNDRYSVIRHIDEYVDMKINDILPLIIDDKIFDNICKKLLVSGATEHEDIYDNVEILKVCSPKLKKAFLLKNPEYTNLLPK